MIIKINKESLDDATKKKLNVDGWHGMLELNLANLKPEIVAKLTETLAPLKKEKGMTKVLRTIEAFNKLTKIPADEACAKAKTIEQYYTSMKRIMTALPSKRLYQLEKDGISGQGRADGYYIEKMAATPRFFTTYKDEGRTVRVWHDGYITLLLVYITDQGLQRENLRLDERDLFGKHPFIAIANAGYMMETPELKAAMIAERKRWREIRGEVGLQLRGAGLAELLPEKGDDDDDDAHNRRYRWWATSHSEVKIKLDKDGPAPLVVDVDKEGDDDNDEKTLKTFAADFWADGALSVEEAALFAKKKDEGTEEEEDDDDDVFEDDTDDDGTGVAVSGNGLEGTMTEESMGPINELPVHPWMTCFNLRGHQRVRLHMSQTEAYVYDTGMRDKLVIDTNSRLLIEMLLHQREQFKDIIAKKGGGAVILCAGPPGTGKTLTSEIFAESEKRPLYSVQCSQLGTSADELEKSLLKIFARAARWKAILLLDEADVYIAKRGSDMNQNAIVGVFLRVLEYYNGVMFMTTNRAESVDDAVLSRCVARIDYTNPDRGDQVKIWHILAASSGLAVGPGVAEEIASKYSLSGRDVKQILKLAGLVAYARKLTTIDAKTIEFCMRFKPTERIKPE
jgi:hypothetical protein